MRGLGRADSTHLNRWPSPLPLRSSSPRMRAAQQKDHLTITPVSTTQDQGGCGEREADEGGRGERAVFLWRSDLK